MRLAPLVYLDLDLRMALLDRSDEAVERWSILAGEDREEALTACEYAVDDLVDDLIEVLPGDDRHIVNEPEVRTLANLDPVETSRRARPP